MPLTPSEITALLAKYEEVHLAQMKMMVAPTLPNHVVTLEFLEGKLEGMLWDPVVAASPDNLDGTKRMFVAINGVYRTNGTTDEPIVAKYNVNG